jgi:hypothetical protein
LPPLAGGFKALGRHRLGLTCIGLRAVDHLHRQRALLLGNTFERDLERGRRDRCAEQTEADHEKQIA